MTGRKRVKRKRLPVVVPVKIKIPVASADMRRHSDTLRGAQRRRKRGLRGENRISVSEFCCLPVSICLPVLICLHVLILSHVLPERVARRENGLCLLSLRQNKNPSFPGHAPGKDTLRAANAATKEGFTGRKRVKRKRLPVVFPPFSERGQTGENARANAVSRRALSPVLSKVGANGGENARTSFLRSEGVCSPVKIKFPVATADMRRHSDTLRGAQRRRKRGLRGENNRTSFLRSKVVVFPS